MASISLPIFLQLGLPVRSPGFWNMPIETIVAVPETASYMNDYLVFGKHDVWLSRQIARVLPKAQSAFVEFRTHRFLRSSAFAPDS